MTSKKDLYFYLAMNIPMHIALAVLTWKRSPTNLGLLTELATNAIYAGLLLLFFYQTKQIFNLNKEILSKPVTAIQHYKFKQVAILQLAYLVTFGSELAVVSMLTLYFLDTFEGLDAVTAGLLAPGFAFMNLVARPSGVGCLISTVVVRLCLF